MKRARGVTGRKLTGLPAALAVATGCMLMSACSASGPYPTIFADPAPRPESTLSPDEVKQATDSLVSDRNHLCSAAVANVAPGGPPPDCAAQTATGTTAKP
jgi:hypothetical protein